MKKNRMMRLASILLVCVLLSTSVISGTFAKYVSSASGSDSATVADWNIELKAGDNDAVKMAYTNNVTVDLFSTILDSNGAAETDISAAKLIAPGTSGGFKFSLQNKSEVTAQYKLDYEVTNEDNIPIVFSVDGKEWKNDITDVAFTTLEIGSDPVEVNIQWKWAFDGDDVEDTDFGIDGDSTVTVEIQIVAEQVD